jgi:hypothetical protein
MKAFSKLKLKPVLITATLVSVGLGGFYVTDRHIKNKTAINNVVTEYCVMALRSDSRILNYCGNSFKIIHNEIVDSDRYSMTVRLHVNGNRGKCKVLAKCQKNSHKYLKSHFEQQLKFSLLSKEEKNISTFTPINYNDVLIPDKKLLEKIKGLTEDKEIFSYSVEKFNSGFYSKMDQLQKEQILNEDEFWRITSLVLISKDSMIFNVRPISNKLKNYDLEDTFYKLNNYQDVIRNVIEFKDKYYSTLNKKLSNEEFRREVNQMKLSNLDKRSRNRKYIVFGEFVFLILGFLALRFFMNKVVIYHPSYFQAFKMVKTTNAFSKILGNNPVVLFTTGNAMFTKNVKFHLHTLGSKNQGIVSFQGSDEPDSINKATLYLKNNEKVQLTNLFLEDNNKMSGYKRLAKDKFFNEIRSEIHENMDDLLDSYEEEEIDKKNRQDIENNDLDQDVNDLNWDKKNKRTNKDENSSNKQSRFKKSTSFFNGMKNLFKSQNKL